jgi:hypothetical protein
MSDPRYIEAGVRPAGPTINRGGSVQEVGTPWNFMAAVEEKFGPIAWDLAATLDNCKSGTGHLITPEQDSLTVNWHELDCSLCVSRLLWLNPPYSNIAPWARKCAAEKQLGAEILLLVPRSGSNWYFDWVEPYADRGLCGTNEVRWSHRSVSQRFDTRPLPQRQPNSQRTALEMEMTTATDRRIFCVGIPGNQPHRTTDDLVGGLCEVCIDKLISARSWGSDVPNLGKSTGKGPGIIINASKHTPPPSKKFRNYPEKWKQPWGMEKK